MQIVDRIAQALPHELAVVIIAMLPVIELRGAIPAGLALGMNPATVFFLSILGNMILMPVIYYLLDPVTRRLRSWSRINSAIEALYERTHAKSTQIKRYGFWGLVVFVGIPLPGTGAVTGVMVASLLRLPFWPTMLALLLGNSLAGIVVTAISLLGTHMLGL